jgi:transcriptional regulator with XRE-family HTH domain
MTMKLLPNPTDHSITQPSDWLRGEVQKYQDDPDFVAEGLALDVMEDAAEIMHDANLSRTALANRMKVSSARVSQLFNAHPNLTLRSVAQVAIALGARPYIGLETLQKRKAARITISETVDPFIGSTTIHRPFLLITSSIEPDMGQETQFTEIQIPLAQIL